ncbi:MAG: nicotinamide riboside transporter PnuC [Prevotella sp.]|nr:nicotinamide riboside transporter PnuC [Prevotella sp.]MDE7088945.1 nicotinamide riboside transporter PnuC [Prevotella sp.]
MDTLRFLDILGFVCGLAYLYFEYKASIYLWIASIVMPAVDMFLYYKAGLYADFGMAVYYCMAAIYGYVVWRYSGKTDDGLRTELPVTRFPQRFVVPATIAFAAVWLFIYWLLTSFTNSSVPVTDSFTTALSIVALWALARKFAEQWLLWLVVDAVCTVLYIYKGIPFKALIYGFYTVVAVFGYRKWLKLSI